MRKIFGTLVFWVFLTGLVWASGSGVSSTGSDPQQMLDFNLAGYGAQGQKTWEVEGASMDMLGDDINISDMRAKLYGNAEDMTLTADSGQFDKQTGVVHLRDNVHAVTESGAHLDTDVLDWYQTDQRITSDDKVKITRENITAVALGMDAQSDFKEATFDKDVVLTLTDKKKGSSDIVEESSGLGVGQMVITCDGPLELSYEKQKAVFHNNVKVDGGPDKGQMYADKMTVFFNTASKQMEKMEADGHVKIVRGENTSYSDSAVFLGAEKKVVLSGRPKLVIFTEEGFDVSP
ncbi:MAG: LPS export ABC transporter periplasmic protein LptC [Candidatus Omnitrophota bacterium]